MLQSTANTYAFQGFRHLESNFFLMPNEWTDITAEIDNLAELKVVEYVLRHTWGFEGQGESKKITLDEFVNGRKRKDGTRIDNGTRLCKKSVWNGLQKALEHGFLEESVNDSDKARVKIFYCLKMDEVLSPRDAQLTLLASSIITCCWYWLSDIPEPTPQDVGVVNVTTQDVGWYDLPPEDVNLTNRTEKETPDTNFISNFENRRLENGEGEDQQNTRDRTGPISASDLMKQRLEVMNGPRSGPDGSQPANPDKIDTDFTKPSQKPVQRVKASPQLVLVVEKVSRELGDTKHIPSNIGQAANILSALLAQGSTDRDMTELYLTNLLETAKSLTLERSADITGSQMAYCFKVVRDKAKLAG